MTPESEGLVPTSPALRVAAEAVKRTPDTLLGRAAVLEALRFSTVLVAASVGQAAPEVRFIHHPVTGIPVLPVFSDAECYRAWPHSDSLGALAVDFAALCELVVELGATWMLLDPDATQAVAINVAVLSMTPDPRQLASDLLLVGQSSERPVGEERFVEGDPSS